MVNAVTVRSEPLRVLLVEDDTLLRASLTSALESHGTRIVRACDAAAPAMAAAKTSAFDVLLTDLNLGDGPTGAVLAHAVRRHRPGVGVVVLTSYADPRLMGTKLAQFPSGTEYVLKESVHDLDVLRATLFRAAMRGAEPFTASPSESRLTDTQVETMRLVADGLTNAEIARRRFVTEKSVEVTVSRILKQLDGDRTLNPRVEIARQYFAMAGSPVARSRTT